MIQKITAFIKNINGPFLLFLLGVSNIKIQVKFLVVIVYALYLLLTKQFQFKKRSSLPVYFYCSMALLGISSAAVIGAFKEQGYWFTALMSLSLWLMGAIIFIILQNRTQHLDSLKVRNSIDAFFIINLCISVLQFLQMVWVSKHPFPYWFTGLDNIYGVSTGDHLNGIFLDNSSVNASISLLAALYYAVHKRYKWALMQILICMMCTSNFNMLVLISSLAIAFVVLKHQRKAFAAILCFSFLTYLMVSPSNLHYIQKNILGIGATAQNTSAKNKLPEQLPTFETTTNTQKKETHSTEEKTEVKSFEMFSWRHIGHQKAIYQDALFPYKKILADFKEPVQLALGSASLHYEDHKTINYKPLRDAITKWYGIPYDSLALQYVHQPGKLIYLKNTLAYWLRNPTQMLMGTGAANYSSKMALKATGLNLQGTYPNTYTYLNKAYFENTFYVHLFYWSKTDQHRSSLNYPGSVYGQISGEYGILGLLIFTVLYVFYFIKKCIAQKEKWILLLALLGLFFFDYWFEMLSLTVFFELFMLIDVKQTKTLSPSKAS